MMDLIHCEWNIHLKKQKQRSKMSLGSVFTEEVKNTMNDHALSRM